MKPEEQIKYTTIENTELDWCYYSGMPSPSFYEKQENDDKKNAEEKNPSAIDEKRNNLSQ